MRHARAALLVLALSSVCACRELVAPGAPPAARGPLVRGVVLSPNGLPVSGATVLVENIKYSGVQHGNWTATTDAQGSFETPLSGPGYYDVFVTYPFVDFERWTFPGEWFDADPDTLQPRPQYQVGVVDFGFDSSVAVEYGRGELVYPFERPGAITGVGLVTCRIANDGSFTAAVPGPGEFTGRFSAHHGSTDTEFDLFQPFVVTIVDTLHIRSPLSPFTVRMCLGGQPAPSFRGLFELRVDATRPWSSSVRIEGLVDLVDGGVRVWTLPAYTTLIIDPGSSAGFIAQVLYPGIPGLAGPIELGAWRLDVIVRTTAGTPVGGAQVELRRPGEDAVRWRASTSADGRAAVRLNQGVYALHASLAEAATAETSLTMASDTELVLRLQSALRR